MVVWSNMSSPIDVMALPHATQPDFDFNVEQPDWVALRMLLAKIQEEESNRRKHLLRKVSDWFLALDMLRDFELLRCVDQEPQTRDRDYQRVFVMQLLAQGERLQLELGKAREIELPAIGISEQEVVANVQFLRDKYSRLYIEIGASRKQEILAALCEPVPAT